MQKFCIIILYSLLLVFLFYLFAKKNQYFFLNDLDRIIGWAPTTSKNSITKDNIFSQVWKKTKCKIYVYLQYLQLCGQFFFKF